MSAVLAALVPIFLLIVMGFLLRRWLIAQDAHWVGLEQLLYYVMFPALLIGTMARADLAGVPVLAVGGTMFAAVMLMAALCFALKPALTRFLGADGPAFTSLFQGATRWQTFVALPRRRKPVRRSRPRARLGRDGGDDAGAQRALRLGAGALRLEQHDRLAQRAARDRAQSADLGLRGRRRAQSGERVHPAAGPRRRSMRSAARRSRSAC